MLLFLLIDAEFNFSRMREVGCFRQKTEGILGKQKKSAKSAFLGWTASEVPLINRAHALLGRQKAGKADK